MSHRLMYNVIDDDEMSSSSMSGFKRSISCCMVNLISLKSQVVISEQLHLTHPVIHHPLAFTHMPVNSPSVTSCLSLRQIMVGDILVSVNDWPLINTPHQGAYRQYNSSNGNGRHNDDDDDDYDTSAKLHFETVLRLLRLATPPRKIRFMRSKEAAASLMTGDSDGCSGSISGSDHPPTLTPLHSLTPHPTTTVTPFS